MTGTLELADRPAFHLSRLMVKRKHTARSLAARAWGEEITAGETRIGTSKGLTLDAARLRVRNTLAGYWTKPQHIEAIARALDVDPGYFYRSAAQAGDA